MRSAIRLYSAASTPISSCESMVAFARKSPLAILTVAFVNSRRGLTILSARKNAKPKPAIASVIAKMRAVRNQRRATPAAASALASMARWLSCSRPSQLARR